MDRQEMIDFLGGVKLFEEFTHEQLGVLAEHVKEDSYRPGDLLFFQNGPREEFFLLLEGNVELFKSAAYGGEQQLALFHEGDFLGEGSWMEGSTHSTSARALTDVKALLVGKDFFRKNADATLKVFSRIVHIVSMRMGQANMQRIHSGAQYFSGATRMEQDLLGERNVPAESYYGIQTLRATENFMVSGVTIGFYPSIVNGLAMVKASAARANCDLGLLAEGVRDAIVEACGEIINGKYHHYFVVDMLQGGAGTSTNMNANEVIANRALEIMGHRKGDYLYCHPIHHVNMSQSTNDTYPTAMRLGVYMINQKLTEAVESIAEAFAAKAQEFAHVVKLGRTQLQDAVPMTLGQEFGAWADMLKGESENLNRAAAHFLKVNMGATVIGTGLGVAPTYAEKCVGYLRELTGFDVTLAPNPILATQDASDFLKYSAELKRLAVKVSKVCNDLRLLSSGPAGGLHEINLPARQPGSAIMPWKVNPVIPEVVNQLAFKVVGNDQAVTMAVEAGQLELNVFQPVVVQSIFESVVMLKNGLKTLQYRCVEGITANANRCREMVYGSVGLAAALTPLLGYDRMREVAEEAMGSARTVYELVLEKEWLTKEEIERVLSPEGLQHPSTQNEK
ncbi:MAG: aspartate ammonia-lyase [Bacteroidetes bacterium]|nr:MAG: aspartate ammonia-lyase [Bacteroidota bacterium]